MAPGWPPLEGLSHVALKALSQDLFEAPPPRNLSKRLMAYNLAFLSHQMLQKRWEEVFGIVVPTGLSRRLMIYALAYEQQAQQSERLKPVVRQQLHELAGAISASPPARAIPLTPGTRLMREWRGTVHVVDVTDGGLIWNGRRFRSLSAIARTITGVCWSGYRFFGLRKRSDAAGKTQNELPQPVGQEPAGVLSPMARNRS